MTTGKGGANVADNIINLDYLRKYMEKKGISEVKLAELIGVDYTTVYRIFKGDRNPGVKFIAGLMKSGLDIDFERIFLSKPLPDGKTKIEQSA